MNLGRFRPIGRAFLIRFVSDGFGLALFFRARHFKCIAPPKTVRILCIIFLTAATDGRLESIMNIIKEKTFYVASIIENLSDLGIPEGDEEKTEARPAGFLRITESETAINYREETEGGPLFTDIIINENGILVKRRGALISDMRFAEGQTDLSVYEIPPYKFDVEIFTRKIRNTLTNDGGKLHIHYNMTIGGAKKCVLMKIEV